MDKVSKQHGLTSIIILTYNQLTYTMKCIESIRKYTEQGTYEIIIVDNASTDGTQLWTKQQDDVTSILNDYNAGFPKGCNQGIEVAVGSQILLLNNDVIVTPNWLENLLACLYSSEKIGAVGPVTNNISYTQKIATSYQNDEEMMAFATTFNVSDPEKWMETLKLVGYCLLIKREVIDKVGGLDEQFTPGNYEDDDFCMRTLRAGYHLMICRDTFIHHYGSMSFSKDRNKFANVLSINSEKFRQKWGFYVGRGFCAEHHLINMMDPYEEGEKLRILDIGCGCGATLLEIKNRYKNVELYGIESNEAMAKIAGCVAKVSSCDVEKPWPYRDKFFDYIFMGDVLEHLYDPWRVVREMKRYLKDGGKVMACIPNMMHYSILMPLIQGKWDYVAAGLLDWRHLRFFTYDGIGKMFRNAHYEKTWIIYRRLNDDAAAEEIINKLNTFAGDVGAYNFFAYQYFIKATVKHTS